MQRITIKEGAARLGVCEQQLRVMIQHGQIAGASYHGPKYRRTYYLTDEHIEKFMKGGTTNEEE